MPLVRVPIIAALGTDKNEIATASPELAVVELISTTICIPFVAIEHGFVVFAYTVGPSPQFSDSHLLTENTRIFDTSAFRFPPIAAPSTV